jgi:hypothetical protein
MTSKFFTGDFFANHLPHIQDRLENWWNHGDQEYPCILITLPPPASVAIPDTEDLEHWWKDVDFILDRQMKLVDNQRYLGVAVPYHFVDRSASAMSGILGARMQLVNKDTMWAYPCFTSVEQVAEMVLDRSNFWYRSTCEITHRSVALAKDHHYVALWALEGVSDILPGLYGTENFLIDLIMKPREVAQAMEHVKRLWLELFAEFSEMIAGTGNRGNIGWAGIWAPGTTFPLQEDISYMLSSAMFRKFCLPHLQDFIDSMEYPLYHLDGVGAIKHLDTLLQIEKLKAIQWVPGTGKERLSDWYALIRRILEGGKSVQVFAEVDEVDELVKNVGARGLLITVEASEEDAYPLIERYKAD